jgi:hypothetical protein
MILKDDKKSDYVKYKLSLFFSSAFYMSLKSARLIFLEHAKSQNLITFKDFFLFLDKKLDFFLQNHFHLSSYDVNSLIRYKLLFINNVAIVDYRTFVSIGDFITIKNVVHAERERLSFYHIIYKYNPLKLFEKK